MWHIVIRGCGPSVFHFQDAVLIPTPFYGVITEDLSLYSDVRLFHVPLDCEVGTLVHYTLGIKHFVQYVLSNWAWLPLCFYAALSASCDLSVVPVVDADLFFLLLPILYS